MKETILEEIIAIKRQRVESAKRQTDIQAFTKQARSARSTHKAHCFSEAIADRTRIIIIAEFKRASPSKGFIDEAADPASVARAYEKGGAAAISVLTEEDFFAGSLNDLAAVRNAVDLPILRKDFIFDRFQIFEAAAAGADAILLIAAMLDDEQIAELRSVAEDELGLDALVEVHTIDELERVKKIGAKLIGINNRDLKSFNVSLDVSRELIKHAPDEAVMVTESGLRTHEDLIELRGRGYSGFLIGEKLMRSGNIEKELKRLAAEFTEISETIAN